MLHEYGIQQGTMTLYCDSMSAINIFKNLVQHSRTKYKAPFYHGLIEGKIISLKYIRSTVQLIDNFTKALNATKFEHLRVGLGVCKF